MKAFLQGKEPDIIEALDGPGREAEYIMLHLRLSSGVDKKEFSEKFKVDFADLIQEEQVDLNETE